MDFNDQGATGAFPATPPAPAFPATATVQAAVDNTANALPDITNGWGTETFDLEHPFVLSGTAYRSLTLRVATGADIKSWAATQKDGTFEVLVLRLMSEDATVLNALHGRDYARLLAKVGKYVTGGD